MRLLVNVPDYRHIHGGVTNHYIGLRPYWTEKVRYNIIGKRREGRSGLWWLPWDYLKFVFLLIFWRPDIVLVNPSMNAKAWPRDRMFLRLARLLGRRTAVMFHGWQDKYYSSIDRSALGKCLNGCAAVFVLCGRFRDELVAAGVTVPIFLTTTKVADGLLEGFDISMRRGRARNFLFFARVVRNKGIFETLDLFKKLKADYPDITLTVAGDGEGFDEARRYADSLGVPDIVFTGHLSGKEVSQLLSRSDFYLFPTFDAEGMPTSLLEAMAFGLPALTRPMGGTRDFFENGKMGVLTESRSADDYYRLLKPLVEDSATIRDISHYNHEYAVSHFMASAVAARMEADMKSIL